MIPSSQSFSRLLEELKKLPGIGERTALRLAFHLLQSTDNMAALAESLLEVQQRVRFCSICFAITEQDPCAFCTDPRDDSLLCVVEEPRDLFAIERSQAFRGRYHVLQGALSPLNGITPDHLRIEELLGRLSDGTVQEVVLATNVSVEGEATALYLARLIRARGVRATRLARGIPIGGDLEYIDSATVQRALEGRSEA